MSLNIHPFKALLVLIATAVLSAGLMFLVGAKPAGAADRSFSPAPNSPLAVGSTPTTVTNADFNGDGKVDLAAQNAGSNNVSVALGNGDGTFQPKQDFAVGAVPTSVISADFNGDGSADLAVANQNSNNVSVLLGNGDGTFQQKTDFAARLAPSSVISADFNGDNFADLAVANQGTNDVSVLLGQDLNNDGKGDGTFQAAQNFAIAPPCVGDLCSLETVEAPNQVIAADFNGDAKADLATANLGRCGFFCSPGGVSVLLGNGDGTFQTARVPTKGTPIPSITATRVDAGTIVDLVATEFNNNAVSVMSGNGNGTFSAGHRLSVGSNPSAVTSADLDNDSVADLAVSNLTSNNISILWGNGGSFQAAQNFPAGVGAIGPAFVTSADFKADNFADLAVANQNSNNVSVLLNTVPPSPPPDTTITSGPSATVRATSATFEFSSTEAGSTFQCSLNGSAFEACSSPKEYSALTDGDYTFEVRATNAVGTDPTPATRNWTVDATAPAAPIITSPANNSFDTDGNITLSGTAEPNSTVDIFEGVASRGTASMDASGAWSKTLRNVSDGSHTYTATAKDAVGNVSNASNARTVIVDTIKPKVLSTTPLAGQTGVAPGTNVSATFSEKMKANSLRNATTLRSTTFTLVRKNANGTITRVAAKVSYNAAAKKTILNPDVNLVRGAKYVATVTTGAKDLAGNPLDQNRTLAGNQPKTWTFTTR